MDNHIQLQVATKGCMVSIAGVAARLTVDVARIKRGTAKFVGRSCMKLECKLPGHGRCGKILYAGEAWDAADEAMHTFLHGDSPCRSAGHHEMVFDFVKNRLGQRIADLRAR